MSARRWASGLAVSGGWLVCLLTACGGGGGGGGTVDDDGGIGIGADGITVFWWRYGAQELGSGSAACATPDGGYALAGVLVADPSFDPDSMDGVLVKTDAEGRAQWQKRYDRGFWDELHDLEPEAAGGYVLAGARRPGPFTAPTPALAWLLATDAAGEPLWETVHGNGGEGGASAIVAIPGGHAVAGDDQGDATLLFVDGAGQVVDERSFGGPLSDRALALARTPAGGFVLAGLHGGTPGDPGPFLWAFETDGAGDVLWDERYGAGAAHAVQARPGGGFLLAGETRAAGGDLDLVVIALDGGGGELWRRTFGGADDDWARGLALTAGDGCVAVGTTRSFSPGVLPFLRDEVYLIELDGQGSTLWQVVKGKSPESSDGADAVVALADGGFLLAGRTNAHPMLCKVDKHGTTIDLGDLDLTLRIPEVSQGLVNFSNALGLAQATVQAVSTLRAVGPFGLELLVEVLGGTSPGDLCSAGALGIDPDPVPLQLGIPYLFTLSGCVLQPAPEPLQAHGTFTLTVESLSGALGGQPSDVQLRYSIPGTEVTDDLGTVTVSGQLTYARSVSASGARTELTRALPGDWLWRTEDGVARRLTEFELNGSGTAALASLGPLELVLEDPSVAGALVARIEPGSPLVGADPEQPETGSLSLTAGDGSRLTLVATGSGRVRLEVDTDADGAVDLALSTSWEALD